MNGIGIALACVAMVGLTVSCTVSIARYDARTNAEAEASWQTWETARAAEGCKVTSFISTGRGYLREVYTCPDGRVVLGRWK
jgi:hypothetical protein